MPRIRSIKPSFWSDEKVCQLGRDARLLAVGLISFADDEGRFLAAPSAIGGYVYPNDSVTPKQIVAWRTEIARVGLIDVYKVGAFEYGWFPQWTKHQRISHPIASTFPAPPLRGISGGIPDQRQNDDGARTA